MIVRELVTLLKYQTDETGANKFRRGFDRLRDVARRFGAQIRGIGAGGFTSMSAGASRVVMGIRRMREEMRRFREDQRKTRTEAEGMGGAFTRIAGVIGSMIGIVGTAAIADEFAGTDARITLAIGNEDEAKEAIKSIFDVAQEAGQAYAATGGLFASVQRNATELELSTAKTLQLTENIGKVMAIGGGSAASQEAALVQLGQALGAGVLRGDELNSIIEQAPRLAQSIAESFGTTVGKLKELGEQGKLTAKQLSAGMLKQTEKINAEFAKMPRTFGRGVTIMRNAWGRFINDLNKGSGASEAFYRISELVAGNIERIAKVLAFAGAAYGLTKLTAGMGALRLASLAALAPFIRMAALLYGLYLLGEDITVWWQGGKSALGELIGPVTEWSRLTDGIRAGLEYVRDLLGDSQLSATQFLAKWGSIAAVGYAIFRVVGLIASGLGVLLRPVGLLARGFLWVTAILAGIVGWPLALAAALGTAVVVMLTNWEGFKAGVEAVWNAIRDFMPDKIREGMDSVRNAVETAWNSIGAWLGKKWDEIVSAFKLPDWVTRFLGMSAADSAAAVQGGVANNGFSTGVPLRNSIMNQPNINTNVTVNAPNADPKVIGNVAAGTAASINNAAMTRTSSLLDRGLPTGEAR